MNTRQETAEELVINITACLMGLERAYRTGDSMGFSVCVFRMREHLRRLRILLGVE